jgi:hypothetical protein
MAAGLGFKTFLTGDVLTAGDTNGYLMQGVLVFASAAARDSAITSPQEGQFAYLKDTNVTTYYTGSAWANLDTTGMTNPMTTTGDTVYSSSGSTPARLGIGSTGQVLTVASGLPSWATPTGGSSGLTLISTVTMSAVSSQNFEGVFSATYTNYKVIMNLVSSVDGAVPQLQYLYSTNTAQSGGYYGGLCGFNYSGTANSDNVTNTFSQTSYSLPGTPITGGNLTTDFDITFFKPNTNDNKANFNIAVKSGYVGWHYVGGGAQNTTRAYTGFKIAPSSGTLTGPVSIYGLAK